MRGQFTKHQLGRNKGSFVYKWNTWPPWEVRGAKSSLDTNWEKGCNLDWIFVHKKLSLSIMEWFQAKYEYWQRFSLRKVQFEKRIKQQTNKVGFKNTINLHVLTNCIVILKSAEELNIVNKNGNISKKKRERMLQGVWKSWKLKSFCMAVGSFAPARRYRNGSFAWGWDACLLAHQNGLYDQFLFWCNIIHVWFKVDDFLLISKQSLQFLKASFYGHWTFLETFPGTNDHKCKLWLREPRSYPDPLPQ